MESASETSMDWAGRGGDLALQASSIVPRALSLLVAAILAGCAPAAPPHEERPNRVVGTWRMVSATVETGGGRSLPYGERPNGMLVFTPDMHFVEVLTQGGSEPFASDARGGGTDAENRRAMATSIGLFGSYTVDANGEFTGNRVEGSTFPNWTGDVRTRETLRMVVEGDRMYETFTRPDGGKVIAEFARVR